jgi:hypothetical protein
MRGMKNKQVECIVLGYKFFQILPHFNLIAKYEITKGIMIKSNLHLHPFCPVR